MSYLIGLLSRSPAPAWLTIILLHLFLASLIWFFFGRDARGRQTIVPDETLIKDIHVYEAGALLAQSPTYGAFIGMILDLGLRGVIALTRVDAGGYVTFSVKRLPGQHIMDSVETNVLKRLFRYSTSVDESEEEAANVILDRHLTEVLLAYQRFNQLVPKQFIQRGWYLHNVRIVQYAYMAAVLIWTVGLYIFLQDRINDPHLSYIYSLLLLLIPFAAIMPRLTKAGALMRERVQGLAWYLRVADKARLQFEENPQGVVLKPGTALAYAVALGIDTDWERLVLTGYEPLKKEYSSPIAK